MLLIIGYITTLLCVFGGFTLAGGHIAAIIQPVELLIICGAALGSLIVGNTSTSLKAICKALPVLFKKQRKDSLVFMDLLSLLYQLLNKARQQGLMSLESDVDEPEKSIIFANYPTITSNPVAMGFICDYFRLIITSNIQPFQLESLMDMEIETQEEEAMIPANAIAKLADAMPAFGIIAAVLGIVHTMESINLPPSELGLLVAHALVGTFLGILIGYGFVGPIASSLEQRAQQGLLMMQCIKVTILASLHNNPPIISIEFGRKALFSAQRPTFNQLNDDIKNAPPPSTKSRVDDKSEVARENNEELST